MRAKPPPGTAARVEPVLQRAQREASLEAGERRLHPSIIAFQLIDDIEGNTVNYLKSKGIDVNATFARKADCSRASQSMRCELEVYHPHREWKCRSQATLDIPDDPPSTAARGPWKCW